MLKSLVVHLQKIDGHVLDVLSCNSILAIEELDDVVTAGSD